MTEGRNASFSLGSFSDVAVDSSWSVDVDWGDGSAHTTFTALTAGPLGSKSHTYTDGPNNRTVTVSVTDKNGGTGTATFQVQVNNVAPSIAISGAPSVNEGSPYSLTLGAVTDPGADTVSSYVVHWGDGQTDAYGTNGVKTHTYADGPNDYAVTVDLVDEDGTFLNAANPVSVHVDNVAPSTPNLLAPADAALTNDNTPDFDWGNSTDPGVDSVTYTIEVDNNNDFSSPENNQSGLATSQFTPASALADGTYNWRVKATDSDTDSSAYSSVRTFTIDATRPTVTINQAGSQPDPTNTAPIHFTAVFSESVSGFASGDVTSPERPAARRP